VTPVRENQAHLDEPTILKMFIQVVSKRREKLSLRFRPHVFLIA
jgi:hypothetical protein